MSIKVQKKAEMDAEKDAIQQKDIEICVFTRVAMLPRLEPQRATTLILSLPFINWIDTPDHL